MTRYAGGHDELAWSGPDHDHTGSDACEDWVYAARMEGERYPARVLVREQRERAIERLSDAFARDELSLEEFERRVDAAFACVDGTELGELVADLSPARATALAAGRAQPLARDGATQGALAIGSGGAEAVQLTLALLGNVERRGAWSLSKHVRALAVFGNVELDLRDVVLHHALTELHVRAVFGNVEIIVPPTLAVETHGVGVLGSFSGVSRLPRVPTDEPLLRIVGSAVLGNVEVRTLPRGHVPRALGSK